MVKFKLFCARAAVMAVANYVVSGLISEGYADYR